MHYVPRREAEKYRKPPGRGQQKKTNKAFSPSGNIKTPSGSRALYSGPLGLREALSMSNMFLKNQCNFQTNFPIFELTKSPTYV